MRLGLKKYDVDAPISTELETKEVKLLLSQHIGAPSVATVSEGDKVKKGDTVAIAKDGALSVALHASIDGNVVAVTPRYIKIKK
jgi:Na+-translocating ferredoxin:NAD+ oxidoreductase RnfC subunit